MNNIKPNLLAIDASNNICSIALQVVDNNNQSNTIIKSEIINNTNKQAACIIPVINNIINSPDLHSYGFSDLNNIDAFVLSNGPGRFTGLRIAASTIQGLAYGFNKKIIAINSLYLLAYQFAKINFINNNTSENSNNIIWVCQKAYNNVYYIAQVSLLELTSWLNPNIKNINFNNFNSRAISKQKLLELYNQYIINNDLSSLYLAGQGWDELKSEINISKINNNIYTEEPDVKYIFDLANKEYNSNNLLEPYGAIPEYDINPYESK